MRNPLRFLVEETIALLNPVQAFRDQFQGQYEASFQARQLRRAGFEVEIVEDGNVYRSKVTPGEKADFAEFARITGQQWPE